jgi:membrane protein implicated in regulation of membrane protease activity
MESIWSVPVIWFVIGFVLLMLEFAVPGLILFFFGVGAWIVAIISLIYEPSINIQLIVFLGSSVLSILLFRNWLKKIVWSKNNSKELIEDEFIGKTGIAETSIAPGINGKVAFKGTTWDATSDSIIEKGQQVLITGNDSILLIVKSITP